MSITFRPAELTGVGLFVAIAGGSRTGKTFSALTLARGIAGSCAKIAAIDTEGRRMSHYANDFRDPDGRSFDVCDLPPPFGGFRFLEAARTAQAAGYGCVVTDSFSLEWSGTGGVLHKQAEWLDREEQRLRNIRDENDNPLTDFDITGRLRRLSDQAWNKVKGPGSEHKLQMDGYLQLTIPIIFCLRANPVSKHLWSKSVQKVNPAAGAWKIDQDQRFLYEWTVGLTLHPDTPGMPRYDMVDKDGKPLWKVQDQHRHLFPEGKLISVEAGAGLAAWRNTDAARSSTTSQRAAEEPTPEQIANGIVDRLDEAEDADDLQAITTDSSIGDRVTWLDANHPKLSALVTEALKRAKARIKKAGSFVPAGGVAA